MNFNSLPLEVVQLVFDILPFRDLLNASLVCRRWYEASETPIIRRSWLAIHLDRRTKDLGEISEVRRSHHNVMLAMVHSWDQLKPVVEICAGRIEVRRLSVTRAWIDCVCEFFDLYKEWLQDVEEVSLSFDHRFFRNDTCSGKSYRIELPKTKFLHWSEVHIRRGNRAVTVSAPKLRRIVVNDSFASKLSLILPNCDELESLECTLYRKNFTELYKASFQHLTTLILKIYYTVKDITFLNLLPNLKWLTLLIEYEKEALDILFVTTIDAICQCSQLEGLQFSLMGDIPSNSLNLNQLAESLPSLQQLELNNVYLSTDCTIPTFSRMTFLKLVNVDLKDDNAILTLDYPSLEIVSLNAKLLSTVYLHNVNLKTLFVNVESLSLAEAIDSYLVPFLNRRVEHCTVQEHVLFKPDWYESVIDGSVPRTILSGIQNLHLINMAVSLRGLRQMAKLPTLKNLKLSKCLIGTNSKDQPDETVVLQHLESIHLSQVQLDNQLLVRFPLVRKHGEELIGRKSYTAIVFDTEGSETGLLEQMQIKGKICPM